MILNNLLLTTTTCLFMFVLFTATNTYAKKKKKSEMYLVLDIDGEINYKATFDSLTEKGCHTCIKAGFGWSEEKQRCGGFENDKCTGDSGSSNDDDDDDEDWEDESDDPDLEGYAAPGNDDDDDDMTDSDGEIDYVKLFAKLTKQGCEACVKKGYGWSEEKSRCGGFANTRCNGKEIEMEEEEDDEEEEVNANPTWKDTDTTTKLWKLISSANYDGLKTLLDDNPSFAKVRSADGRGPLFWAYEYSQPRMASLLSFKGADTKAKDKHGKTPNGIADTSDVIDHDAGNAGNDDEDEDVGGGTDMSKMFKGLTKKGCKACVAAGYGWCPIKLMCGGFANRKCADDVSSNDDDDDDDMDDDLEGYASG